MESGDVVRMNLILHVAFSPPSSLTLGMGVCVWLDQYYTASAGIYYMYITYMYCTWYYMYITYMYCTCIVVL